MDLDFSRLDSLAYRCFPTEEARDTLIEQGFMVIEGDRNSFEAPPDTQGSEAMLGAVRAYKARHPSPCSSPAYWEEAVKDLYRTAGQFNMDARMIALLEAAYRELEAEYRAH